MANSWNGPQLGSPIRTDVQELQKKLIALLKGDPTSVADIPSGAKRLVNTSGVQWQVQQYNGSSWAAIDKLMHDVDTLDGYHAAITPAANTVAVRNADKKLEGDITGNAATASSATTLSETLPVNKGGTGATTSEQARANLGVPPTSHASSTATFGLATDTKYGHARSDGTTTNIVAGEVVVKDVAIGGDVSNLASKRGQIGGVANIPESGVDFHELTKSGVYFFTDVAIKASKNTPPTNAGGFCVVYSRESQPYNFTKHVYYLCTSPVIYTEETKNNSMEWSNWVENINSTNVATNAKAGIVKPQTGAEDGLELGPDGTLRLRVAAPTVRGGVKASETPQAYTVPHSRADGTIDPAWIPSVFLQKSGGQIDGEVVFGTGYAIRRNNDTGALVISGGTSYDTNDGSIILHGKNDPNPGVAGIVELLAGGGRVSFGYNGIFYPNNNRVMFNQDFFIQAVPPNGPVYSIPSGGTWSFTRLQWDLDGNIAEVSTQTVAGGSAANISNTNAQLLIAYRVSV